MSPFLVNFSSAVVRRLQADGLLEVAAEAEVSVVHHVAHALGSVHQGSLISSLVKALVSADGVEELYADDDDLKRIVESLGPGATRS